MVCEELHGIHAAAAHTYLGVCVDTDLSNVIFIDMLDNDKLGEFFALVTCFVFKRYSFTCMPYR